MESEFVFLGKQFHRPGGLRNTVFIFLRRATSAAGNPKASKMEKIVLWLMASSAPLRSSSCPSVGLWSVLVKRRY